MEKLTVDSEPKVSTEAKEKAVKVYDLRKSLAEGKMTGTAAGFKHSAMGLFDELVGAGPGPLGGFGWGDALFPGSSTEEEREERNSEKNRWLPRLVPKDDDQTRYLKMPMLDAKGNIAKTKEGKPRYRYFESPEEMLKASQDGLLRESRMMMDRLVKMRNTAGIGFLGKGREEVIDTAQGFADIMHLFIPLLSSLDATAIATLEHAESDPNFDFEDAKFEQVLAGFQEGKAVNPGILSYLAPIVNSMAINVGASEGLAPDESKRATALGGIPLPITDQLKQQAIAMPIDTITAGIPVLNLLKGWGSAAAAAQLTKHIKAMKAAGKTDLEIAQAQRVRLDDHFSSSQKSMLRRVIESSVGRDADSKAMKWVGSAADVATTAAKFGATAYAFGDVSGALGEAAVLSGVGGTASSIGALVKNVPGVRRWLTPEIWASSNAYVEAAGAELALDFGDMQNLLDSYSMRAGYQAGRGEVPGDEGLRIKMEELPAYVQDNVARITARVDIDSGVQKAKAILDEMDPESPGFEAAKAAVAEQRRNLFIQYSEESGLVFRENRLHKNLTRINRERGESNLDFDRDVEDVVKAGQQSIADEALIASQEQDIPRLIADTDSRLEDAVFRQAESDVDFDLGMATARTVHDDAVADVHLNREARVGKAEARLKKAKEEYKKSLQSRAGAEKKLKENTKATVAKRKSAKAKNKAKQDGFSKLKALRERYDVTQARMKSKVQQLTEAKVDADKRIGPKVTIADRLNSIERRFNKRSRVLSARSDKANASLAKERISLTNRRSELDAQEITRASEIENARLFSEGEISLDELVARRADSDAPERLAAQSDNVAKEVAKLEQQRAKRLEALASEEGEILNAMRHEYQVTLNYKDGVPLADTLIKKRRHHIFLDGNKFESVPVKNVKGGEPRPGAKHETITYEDPGSRAGSISQQISNMPIASQPVVVEAIQKAAVALVDGVEGIIGAEKGPLKGGGKNAAYRWFYESLSQVVFDEMSPKLLKSPSMRDDFKRFLADKLGSEYGLEVTPDLIANIEKLVNDFASPRASGQSLYTEIGHTFYRKRGGEWVPITTIEDLFTQFAQTKLSKKQLRRMSIEAIQTELPVLTMRVGTNVAVNTALRRSGTNLDDFKKGVYLENGEVNKPYVRSIIKIFKENDSLPITFRTGKDITLDLPDGQKRVVLGLQKALFMDMADEARAVLGVDGFERLRKAVDEEFRTIGERKWQRLGDDTNFMGLPEFQSIGEGKFVDKAMGLKTSHPAIAAEVMRSSVGAFKDSAKGGDILINKEFGDTVGWLLKTHWIYSKGAIWTGMRTLTALLKMAKTALNPINHATNFTSNYITLMSSEGLDPFVASGVIANSAKHMLQYIYEPHLLSPEARVQMNAIMETGGINQTILVQEIEQVLHALEGQGARKLGMVTAAYTGRHPGGQILGHSVKGAKGKAVRAYGELSAAYVDNMKKGYRMFGDELFKYTKTRLDMAANAKYFDDMAPGSGVSFRDLARGNWGEAPFMGHVSKTFDGDFIVIHPNGKSSRGNAAVLKLNAHASMQSANAFYFNLGDLGKLGRIAVSLEGVALSPFLSWRMHSMDVPGLKKGLFYRMFIDNEYRASTDPSVARSLAMRNFSKSARRALLVAALKRREIDAYDLRKALPSWLENAFINKDLSMILADNQVPFSGFIDYIAGVTGLANLLDPARRGSHLFWEKVFTEKNQKALFQDLMKPSILETAQVVFGREASTSKKFKTTGDWLMGVVNQVGDGRVTVPKRMIDSLLEQQSATTLSEINGMDRDLVQKRKLYGDQSMAVGVMNTLLMRRYRHLNKSKVIKILAEFPKAHIDGFFRRLEKEYQIPFGDKRFNKNPFGFLVGRGVNEENARFIADEFEDMKILFGGSAVNTKIKPGDNQKIAGSFAVITKRLIDNMANDIGSKEARDKFRKETNSVMRDSLSFDDDYREIEDILSGRDEENF